MSEETKNPLIESFLKLHEYKNPGYGGKGDPYQGRNLQPYMNQKDIPAALKVKETPAAPSPMVPKPTPKPEQPVKAVTPTGSPKMDTEKTSLGNDFKLPPSTSLKPPMGQNAAGSQVGNNSNPAYTPKPAVAQNSSTKGNETNPIRDAADAAYEYGDSAVKKLEQSIAGKKYSKDKFQEFMKWLKSNQNTNEVTEETLNEFAGGTAQDKIPMQQRINNASGSSLRGFSNATNSTNIVRANQSTSALGGFANTVNSTNIVRANQSTSALGGFGNVPNSTNIVRANQSSSTQTYKPDLSTRQNAELGSRALGGFSKVPDSLQTQREKSASALNFPGKGTTGLGATSPEGFIKRMSGIEKANPIAAPGKLAGGNLSLGSRGDAVKELQRKLGVSDDGIFGPKTAEALKKMQQSAGLKADAIYGKQSASYLARKDALSNLRKENPIGAEKMEAGTGNNLQDHSSGILSARSAYERKEAGDISPGWNSLTGRVKSTHSALEDREYANRERENAKREQKFKQGIREESPSMSNKLIDSFMKLQSLNSSNIFEAAKKIKKLDPVGKEDGDLNNDGEENREDDYIKNRREAIKAAMKEGKDPNAELDAPSSGGKAPETSTNPEWLKKMKPQEQTPTSNLKGSLPKGVTVKGNTNEEVEFSEAELAHIAAILEGPVAPTPDDYSGSKNGPSVRNLSDETVSEEEVKRGRGRPKGSKSGSAKGEGQAAGTPHIMDQIKFASARGIADGKGNYMLKHPTSGETRAVPQKAANDAYRDYHGEAKPAGKNAVLSGFLKKHGFSDTSAEKAPEEKRTTAEPKKSVSLPSMPKPKS
jgi:hypothetical protein